MTVRHGQLAAPQFSAFLGKRSEEFGNFEPIRMNWMRNDEMLWKMHKMLHLFSARKKFFRKMKFKIRYTDADTPATISVYLRCGQTAPDGKIYEWRIFPR